MWNGTRQMEHSEGFVSVVMIFKSEILFENVKQDGTSNRLTGGALKI